MNPIVCGWGLRADEGSCNVCQTHDDALVLVVKLPTMCFRVCHKCASTLRSTIDVYL